MRALFLCVLLAVPGAAFAVEGPIAVMPFRNLNQDADLDWLSRGIAETMISDIRGRRKDLTVVERDQIERALKEVNFQQTGAVDSTTASAIGRVVGAKTIVVGGYQKAGKQLRITARFVVVETGVIQDTAKITGEITGIFGMQDQIVRRLLKIPTGKKPPKGAQLTPKPTPKPTEKTVKAYKLYALSLNTQTDVKRTEMLQASLEVDPSFRYARHDLESLERRMREYHERALRELSDEMEGLYKTLRDEEKPESERAQAAMKLHVGYITNGFYSADLALGEEMYTGDWREPAWKSSMRENGLVYMMQAYAQLGRYDEALQVGEQFLQEFPTSMQKLSIEYSMKSYIQKKRNSDLAPAKATAALARLENEMREAESAHEDYRDQRIAQVYYSRCYELHNAAAYLTAVRECEEMISRYGRKSENVNIQLWARLSRLYLAQSLHGAGQFTRAREVMNDLIEDEPEFAAEMYLDMRVRQWPRE